MLEAKLREDICEIGRRLYARGYTSANEGNLSCRLADNVVLCTPTMISKGYMAPSDLVTVDLDANQISGERRRTSEIRLHLAIYRHRPDVRAVIHAHPPHATAFAITGTSVPTGIHPEQEFFLGKVPTVPYSTPGTAEFAESAVPLLPGASALILASHGAATMGATLESAWFSMEILDAYCRLLLTAMPLGPAVTLSRKQLDELAELKKSWPG